MAKKSTKQGIGYINNQEEFGRLVVAVANIITQEFNRSSDNATAINNIKSRIDNFVGRSRQSFTKTDVYQVSYLMFYPIVKTIQEGAGKTFKDTQVNTLVAKLMTEGEYGNPSVVRRQTASAKLSELKRRLFPNRENLFQPTNEALTARLMLELPDVARRMLVRGTRSTTTTRVSNRTRRTTPARTATPTRTATPAPSQVTESSSTGLYTVTALGSESALRFAISESIKRFGETSDKRMKFGHIANAWRYTALLNALNFNETANIPRNFFPNTTSMLITRIGDVYNPALPGGGRYVEALEYVKYICYILASGKIRIAQELFGSRRLGETRQTLSRKIFEIGIGRTSEEVFSWFAGIVGSRNIYSMVANMGGSRFYIDQLKNALSAVRRPTTRVTPTATVTEIIVPGYTSEATPPAPAPPPPVDNLIRNMKITDAFDFGVEWEHFGLGLPKIKRAMEKIGQPLYPEYVPYHDFDSYDRAIKPGMFPNGKINKGWWVLQVDGSVRPDPREPASEFRKTKEEAVINQRGRTFDTYQGEFVSPVLGGKRGLAIIKLVGNALVNLGMRHNRTMGMHTHVTKKGFNRTNIKNLMYNYVAMEPLIESMMEPNRRSTAPGQYNRSHFKQLDLFLSSTENQVKQKLKQYILDKSDDDFYRMFGTSKQQAVNLKPFYGGNTIEFRQQGANFEADSVTMWIAFLFYLCEFSKKKRFQNFQWNNLISIMPVGLASFWYNRIQDLTGKSPYELSFQKS